MKVNRMNTKKNLNKKGIILFKITENNLENKSNSNAFVYNKEEFSKNISEILKKIDFKPSTNKKSCSKLYTSLKKFEKFKSIHIRKDNVIISFILVRQYIN